MGVFQAQAGGESTVSTPEMLIRKIWHLGFALLSVVSSVWMTQLYTFAAECICKSVVLPWNTWLIQEKTLELCRTTDYEP